jgi:hypothetical protein
VTRLTLTSSGQERGAEDDEEDDGNRAADRRREVQEELERAWDLEISVGIKCCLVVTGTMGIFLVNLW